MADQDPAQVSYEDLALIEEDFEAIDTDIMRKQYTLSLPIYAKRAAAVSAIPNFWALVFEQSPPEIDQFIQPGDSAVFAEALQSLHVSRPEIEPAPASSDASKGNPRTLRFRFEFGENEWFEDTVLEKTFWYRRARDGWTGLVSEPVGVRWKKGKDLTQGMLGKAVRLFEARRKAGEWQKRDLKEFEALKKEMESRNPVTESFFNWFGFVSSRRFVSAEESEGAVKEHAERKARGKEQTGEELGLEAAGEEDEPEGDDAELVELNPNGDELAIALADDVWPGAIRFFLQAQEMDGDMSDGDFEEMEEGDISDLDDDEGAPVDIRALVNQSNGGKGGKGRAASGSGQPPSKKMKK